MKTKTFQVLLVVAAVLFALGIGGLLQGRDLEMPEPFEPPAWLSALEGLAASKPRVTRGDLTPVTRGRRGQRGFPSELSFSRRTIYSVAPDPDTRLRELEFQILSGSPTISYQTNEPEQTQEWPDPDYPNADPVFMVYQDGGSVNFTGTARVRMVE